MLAFPTFMYLPSRRPVVLDKRRGGGGGGGGGGGAASSGAGSAAPRRTGPSAAAKLDADTETFARGYCILADTVVHRSTCNGPHRRNCR